MKLILKQNHKFLDVSSHKYIHDIYSKLTTVTSPLYSINELKSMLDSNDPEERGAAARRIWTDWKLYDPIDDLIQFEDTILQLLKNDLNSRNTWHYMISLGQMNSLGAVDYMVERLVNSEDENIRGFAADALGRYDINQLPEDTMNLLWKLAENDPSLVVRINSIRACSEVYKSTKNSEISKRLFNLLKSQTHSAVTTTILQLLGEIGSTSVVADLIHIMITRRTDTHKKMAGIALDSIAIINGYKNRDDLIKLMNDEVDN